MAAAPYTYPIELVVGALLLVLAAVVLRFSSDRVIRWPLGAFIGLVGANHLLIGGVNSSSLLPDDLTEAWRPVRLALYHAADVLQLLDAPALVLATVALTRRRFPGWLLPSLGAVLAACAALFLLTIPADAVDDFSTLLSRPVVLTLGGVYLASFAYLVWSQACETRPLQRDRLGQFTVALGAVVLSRVALVWKDVAEASDALAWSMVGTSAALFAAAFAFAWLLHRPDARDSILRTFLRLGLALAAIAAGWLLYLEASLRDVSQNLWYVSRWLVFALLLAAGIHRLGLLEIGPKGERRLWAALTAAAFVTTALLLWALLAGVGGADPASSFAASLAVAGLVAAMLSALSGSRPGGASALQWRQRSIYRAHLELGTDPEELERLRDRLRIPPEEARRMADLVEEERRRPEAASDAPVPGRVWAGRYLVETVLGVGGFGRAFLAVDTVGGGQVVLKEMLRDWRGDPKALGRFRDEVRILLRTSHPNLVRFRDLERVAGGHVLVLDYVEGRLLRQKLATGPLSARQTVHLGARILDALASLHAQGIVHGDVKPENIVVRPDGQPVLLDFGAARVVARRTQRDAAAAGTQEYMAPERRRGQAATPASDLWALAVVLWECAAGRLPPDGKVPPALQAVLRRAQEADPAKRWPDAAAMAAALRKAG